MLTRKSVHGNGVDYGYNLGPHTPMARNSQPQLYNISEHGLGDGQRPSRNSFIDPLRSTVGDWNPTYSQSQGNQTNPYQLSYNQPNLLENRNHDALYASYLTIDDINNPTSNILRTGMGAISKLPHLSAVTNPFGRETGTHNNSANEGYNSVYNNQVSYPPRTSVTYMHGNQNKEFPDIEPFTYSNHINNNHMVNANRSYMVPKYSHQGMHSNHDLNNPQYPTRYNNSNQHYYNEGHPATSNPPAGYYHSNPNRYTNAMAPDMRITPGFKPQVSLSAPCQHHMCPINSAQPIQSQSHINNSIPQETTSTELTAELLKQPITFVPEEKQSISHKLAMLGYPPSIYPGLSSVANPNGLENRIDKKSCSSISGDRFHSISEFNHMQPCHKHSSANIDTSVKKASVASEYYNCPSNLNFGQLPNALNLSLYPWQKTQSSTNNAYDPTSLPPSPVANKAVLSQLALLDNAMQYGREKRPSLLAKALPVSQWEKSGEIIVQAACGAALRQLMEESSLYEPMYDSSKSCVEFTAYPESDAIIRPIDVPVVNEIRHTSPQINERKSVENIQSHLVPEVHPPEPTISFKALPSSYGNSRESNATATPPKPSLIQPVWPRSTTAGRLRRAPREGNSPQVSRDPSRNLIDKPDGSKVPQFLRGYENYYKDESSDDLCDSEPAVTPRSYQVLEKVKPANRQPRKLASAVHEPVATNHQEHKKNVNQRYSTSAWRNTPKAVDEKTKGFTYLKKKIDSKIDPSISSPREDPKGNEPKVETCPVEPKVSNEPSPRTNAPVEVVVHVHLESRGYVQNQSEAAVPVPNTGAPTEQIPNLDSTIPTKEESKPIIEVKAPLHSPSITSKQSTPILSRLGALDIMRNLERPDEVKKSTPEKIATITPDSYHNHYSNGLHLDNVGRPTKFLGDLGSPSKYDRSQRNISGNEGKTFSSACNLISNSLRRDEPVRSGINNDIDYLSVSGESNEYSKTLRSNTPCAQINNQSLASIPKNFVDLEVYHTAEELADWSSDCNLNRTVPKLSRIQKQASDSKLTGPGNTELSYIRKSSMCSAGPIKAMRSSDSHTLGLISDGPCTSGCLNSGASRSGVMSSSEKTGFSTSYQDNKQHFPFQSGQSDEPHTASRGSCLNSVVLGSATCGGTNVLLSDRSSFDAGFAMRPAVPCSMPTPDLKNELQGFLENDTPCSHETNLTNLLDNSMNQRIFKSEPNQTRNTEFDEHKVKCNTIHAIEPVGFQTATRTQETADIKKDSVEGSTNLQPVVNVHTADNQNGGHYGSVVRNVLEFRSQPVRYNTVMSNNFKPQQCFSAPNQFHQKGQFTTQLNPPGQETSKEKSNSVLSVCFGSDISTGNLNNVVIPPYSKFELNENTINSAIRASLTSAPAFGTDTVFGTGPIFAKGPTFASGPSFVTNGSFEERHSVKLMTLPSIRTLGTSIDGSAVFHNMADNIWSENDNKSLVSAAFCSYS